MHCLTPSRLTIQLSCVLLVLLGCVACSTETPEKPGTLNMTPQSTEFVRAYKARALTGSAADNIPLQASARIGAASDPNVCETGEIYGPFTITNGALEGAQTVSADQSTLRLANMGDLKVCLIVTSPVDATLDLSADSLAIKTTECTKTPANISGFWEGNYSCTSSCGNQDGFVSLNIEQDNYSATYTDDEASYKGTVCGNVFKYSGSGPGYTESGTFILNNDGTASKTSHYVYTDGLCSGDCSDPVLTRYEIH